MGTSDRLYRRLTRPAVDWARDLISGIETRDAVRYERLAFGPDRGLDYVASDWRALPIFLDAAPVRTGDVFVDLGCGKGRVLFQAAKYRFSRVIGVELDEGLAEVARRNTNRIDVQIEIVVADVTVWTVPDDVTHIYLYNPFRGAVMEAALSRLGESLDRSPRELRIGYVNPVDRDALVAHGAVPMDLRRLRGGDGYVVEIFRLGQPRR
ncbi:MAG TPA: methyltransferase domain-containing protein [Candidatus Binatia bacterium]|nr:methyltransferase domain-containing protein [Candidatus Binatia bacterium]